MLKGYSRPVNCVLKAVIFVLQLVGKILFWRQRFFLMQYFYWPLGKTGKTLTGNVLQLAHMGTLLHPEA